MKQYILILTFLASCLGLAQEMKATTTASFFDLLETEAISELTLTADFTMLLNRPAAVDDYLDGSLVFKRSDGTAVQLTTELKSRGKYRRRICDFPPLKLNFSKKELRGLDLAGEFDKYKLVTHCMEDRQAAKEAVIREYLTYRLYNEWTSSAYRVHLLRIRYVDTGAAQMRFERYAFLIESSDQLAERLQAERCEDCIQPSPDSLSAEDENRMALFQYWIGNVDYSLAIGRNVHLFRASTSGKLIPVPYDFDFSGSVGAPYALPQNSLGQKAVGDRIFLGLPAPDELFARHIVELTDLRTRADQIIRRQRGLSMAAKQEMRTYLGGFEQTIAQLNGNSLKYHQFKADQPEVIPIGSRPEYYRVGR